jgi:hypothetical protein
MQARRGRIALFHPLFSLADTRRPEINDPGRYARLATCESEAQLNLLRLTWIAIIASSPMGIGAPLIFVTAILK